MDAFKSVKNNTICILLFFFIVEHNILRLFFFLRIFIIFLFIFYNLFFFLEDFQILFSAHLHNKNTHPHITQLLIHNTTTVNLPILKYFFDDFSCLKLFCFNIFWLFSVREKIVKNSMLVSFTFLNVTFSFR